MADNLYPEGYEEEAIEESDVEEEQPVGYLPGVEFAWEKGDFVRDGKNMLQEASGIESWKQWCQNCLQTERYKHLAYSTDFGIETEEAFKAPTREEAESILLRQITEAILADPYGRASYINEIEFTWTAPDAVQVSMTIVGIDDVTIDVEVNITEGE